MDISDKSNTSCEPMDVDISLSSFNQSQHDISPKDNVLEADSILLEPESFANSNSASKPPPEKWHYKKYRIKRLKKETSTSHITLTKSHRLLLTILILCISLLIYYLFEFKCAEELDLPLLRNQLENRLFNQDRAIQLLIDGLNEDTQSKVLILYGGTGVGKTLTTSIILQDIWNTANIYHFTMPSILDTFSPETMFGLHICKRSIVILDDLKYSDVYSVKGIVNSVLQKGKDLNKKVTIMLVFNCDIIANNLEKKCDSEFILNVLEAYSDIKVYKKIIHYKPLTQDTLIKCIEYELGNQKVKKQSMKTLLNNFNVTLDGCKGVYKKIKLLNPL